MRRLATTAGTLALLLAAACRHGEAATDTQPATDAAPAAAESHDDARVVDAAVAKTSGVVVELGSSIRIKGPQFAADVFAEFRPTEFVSSGLPDGSGSIRCTVRLRRADGRDVGRGHATLERNAQDIREPAAGWTGLVAADRDTVLYFDPPAVERLAAHRWVLSVRAEPIDATRVRLRASGAALIYCK